MKNNSQKCFSWEINPREEVELVEQAFKTQQCGKTSRRRGSGSNLFWHINRESGAKLMAQSKCKDLKLVSVQENGKSGEKEQDQFWDDQMEKKQNHKIAELLKDAGGSCDLNDDRKEFDENDEEFDLSFSSSEIVLISESE